MKALTLNDHGLTLQGDLPTPDPSPGEALVRVTVAGICATDLEIVKGYAGFRGVLGHEFVGVVEDVHDDADAAWRGRRVVGSINLGCGRCPECLASGPEHCLERRVLGIVGKDGAFAEALTLPTENLHAVPDALADAAAVFTEPLAAALRIRQQVTLSPSERRAVVGPGRLGLLVAQVLGLDGAKPTVLGRREESLVLARGLGFLTGLAGDAGDGSFDLVVEATGNPQGLAQALRLVRPKGTLVLKSTFAGDATVDLSKLVVSEVWVVGSRCGPFAPALALLAAGKVAVAPLVDARYPLSRGLEAFAHAERPGTRKVLLDVSSGVSS